MVLVKMLIWSLKLHVTMHNTFYEPAYRVSKLILKHVKQYRAKQKIYL